MGYGRNSLDAVVHERFLGLQPICGVRIPCKTRRINVVTDSINRGSLFGGVATSLIFATLLAQRWNCDLRIITRTELPHKRNFRRIIELNGISWDKGAEFVFLDLRKPGVELPVSDEDIFLTTSWWTTWSIKEAFGENMIIYLLQEDERGFYPSGDDYLRCTRVLQNPRIRFVVNTKLLYDHLISEGFENIRRNGCWFEPAFSEELYYYERQPEQRKKNFFFYARPNNPRNLYYLGLEVIREAVASGILDLEKWDVFVVGRNIPKLRIADSYLPRVFQNMAWDQYAALTRKVDLGLCLMLSPHPSYPPLDLASCGAVVVTNRYGLKQNLDAYSKNILCVDADKHSLVQAVSQGIILATDLNKREKNLSENGISKDWNASFEQVIANWGKRPSNVRV